MNQTDCWLWAARTWGVRMRSTCPENPLAHQLRRARRSGPPHGIEANATSSELSSSISQSLGQLRETYVSMMCLSHVATRTHRGVFRAVDTEGTSNTKGTARSLRPKSSIHTHWGHALQCRPSLCATGAAQSKKHRGRCARPPGCGERNRAHGKGCASSQAAYTSGPSR